MRTSTITRAVLATSAMAVTLGAGAGIAGAETRPASLSTPARSTQFVDICTLAPSLCPEPPHPGDPFPNESSFDYCSTFLAKDPVTGEEWHREVCSTLTIDWGGAAPETTEG